MHIEEIIFFKKYYFANTFVLSDTVKVHQLMLKSLGEKLITGYSQRLANITSQII